MTIDRIIHKLSRKSRGSNRMFNLAVCFAVALVGAYGVLLFSPTITNVLMTDGSTYIISLGMYIITIIGIAVFIIYANEVYTQFQMKETGVLLALGLMSEKVTKMRNRQFDQLYLSSGLVGLILAVPIAFCYWRFLTLFLNNTDHRFHIGRNGLLFAGILWIILWIMLRRNNTVRLSKADVMEILHAADKQEEIKGSGLFFGVAGFISIPTGLILFNITAAIAELKSVSVLFLGLSITGIYLLSAQITSVGEIVRRYLGSAYRENILYFNLLKQKGRQYTLSLFVSTLLIVLTVFSICFNGSTFLDAYYLIKENPYDYSVFLADQHKELDVASINAMALENNINLTEWQILELLLIGREHQYADSSRNEWASELVVSESDFNELSGMELSMADDSFVVFEESDDAIFQTFFADEGNFYNPTTKEDFTLTKGELLSRSGILNSNSSIYSFIIVNDRTFSEISENLDPNYIMKYHQFNGDNTQGGIRFQNELFTKILELSEYKIFTNFLDQPAFDKRPDIETNIIPYEGNEQYTARWWTFFPHARQTELSIQMEIGVVYLLLVFFISIVTFVAASLIIGLKIAGTIMQDRESYQKAMYLGLSESKIKMLIKKQIKLIYFFPTVCGCFTAVLMMNRFIAASSMTHVTEITIMTILLSLMVFMVQLVVYFYLRKKQTAAVILSMYNR